MSPGPPSYQQPPPSSGHIFLLTFCFEKQLPSMMRSRNWWHQFFIHPVYSGLLILPPTSLEFISFPCCPQASSPLCPALSPLLPHHHAPAPGITLQTQAVIPFGGSPLPSEESASLPHILDSPRSVPTQFPQASSPLGLAHWPLPESCSATPGYSQEMRQEDLHGPRPLAYSLGLTRHLQFSPRHIPHKS